MQDIPYVSRIDIVYRSIKVSIVVRQNHNAKRCGIHLMNTTAGNGEHTPGKGARPFTRFIQRNIAICNAIEQRLPKAFTRSLLYLHENLATEEMSARTAPTILDIGGGRNSPIARRITDAATKLIAADIDLEELTANNSVNDKLVLDATQTLPFQTDSIDIVVTRSVMEHLPETENFISECRRILKSEGVCLHVMPCKFAPFSIINQIIPNSWAQAILYRIYPQWTDSCGFKAYYNNCYMPRIANLFSRNNFHLERIELRYYQSIYFKFFVPFYLLSLIYDLVVYRLEIKPLSCQVLIVARK